MQLWAKEDQERDTRLHSEQQQRIQQEKLLRQTQEKEQQKQMALQEDIHNLDIDVRETQLLRQTMRKCGVRSGVNVAAHHLPVPEESETTRVLTFKLRDNVNLEWKLKHQRTPDILMPFDVDLKLYRDVETLRGVNIGERGALALAGEFVRGACSNLITLDLSRYASLCPELLISSRCQIHSRGFGRVLHGLRMGRVINLQSLKLRGNSLTPSAVEYLRAGRLPSLLRLSYSLRSSPQSFLTKLERDRPPGQ